MRNSKRGKKSSTSHSFVTSWIKSKWIGSYRRCWQVSETVWSRTCSWKCRGRRRAEERTREASSSSTGSFAGTNRAGSDTACTDRSRQRKTPEPGRYCQNQSTIIGITNHADRSHFAASSVLVSAHAIRSIWVQCPNFVLSPVPKSDSSKTLSLVKNESEAARSRFQRLVGATDHQHDCISNALLCQQPFDALFTAWADA